MNEFEQVVFAIGMTVITGVIVVVASIIIATLVAVFVNFTIPWFRQRVRFGWRRRG